MNILLVEDSQTQAEKLKIILTKHGYEATLAPNGQEALEKINKNNFDLVISDIIMPIMDGYTFCENLRKDPKFKTIPIILLTTLSESEDIVRGLECGANYFVTKPYVEEEILKHVKTALEIHKLREAATDENNVHILLNGKEHVISAEKSQIVDLLVSIYSAAVSKNHELYNTRLQLQQLNNLLEKKVEIRTQALRAEIDESEKTYSELKKRAADLEAEITTRRNIESLLRASEGHFRELSKKLKYSLDEKVILLKEVYHRVKNNLQIISSLLRLQADTAKEPETKQFSKESISRIGSMALIHEMLYQSETLIKINLADYTQKLIQHLYATFSAESKAIELHTELQDIPVDFKDAIPFGLIVSELLSNVFKYAFPHHQNGKISVALTKQGDMVFLTVADNGIGVSKEIDIKKSQTLGIKLINTLVSQLNGQVKLENVNGSKFTVQFPLNKIEEGPVEKIKASTEGVV